MWCLSCCDKGDSCAVFLIRRTFLLNCALEIQREHEGEGSLGMTGMMELGIPAVPVVALGREGS